MRLALGLGWAQRNSSETPDAILDAATRVLDLRDTTVKTDLIKTLAPLSFVENNGDAIAMTLDRSQGVSGDGAGGFNGAGAEGVTNGGFDTDLTGWTPTNAVWEDGAARVANGRIDQNSIVTGAGWILIKWDQTVNAGTRSRVRFRNAANSADVRAQTYYSGTGPVEEVFYTSDGLSLQMKAEASDDVTFDNVSVKFLPGNHAYQDTASLQKTWTEGAGGTYDGVDDRDLIDLPSADRTADMTLFMVVDTSDLDHVLFGTTGTAYIGYAKDADASTSVTTGAGTPTLHINGGASLTTRDALSDALAIGAAALFEARGADLTGADWAEAQVSGLGASFMMDGKGVHAFLVDGSDAATIDPIRQAIADKFGITLS